MNGAPDDRVLRLIGGDHLVTLRRRLRRRFERAVPGRACETFRLNGLTSDEYAALASLMGHSPRYSNSLLVDLRVIDAALQHAGIATSLRSVLEQLDGPIIRFATMRDQQQTLWSSVISDCSHPCLVRFLQAPAAIGLLKRLSGGDPAAATELRCRVEAVLQCLPADGLTRAQLAADVLGDAHALDNGRATATLVLAVWRQVVAPGEPESADAGAESRDENGSPPDLPAEHARNVWARAGVLVNELARPAVFLNLPVNDSGRYARSAGEPAYVSLRALLRSPPAWDVAGRAVYVCENPNLLSIAADRLGQHCPPMVCTDGMPAAAQNGLLNQLARAGAVLHYHGDFDWAGLRIGNYIMREFDARSWRFGATDYCAAVAASARPGRQLDGVPVLASWDAELTPMMQRNQLAVAEEAVAASLLQDLGRPSAARPPDP